MASKVHPLGDRVVVKRVEPESVTKGGIVIPDNAHEKSVEGIVLEVGPGNLLKSGDRKAIDVKKNDKVVFGKYAGTEIKINGEDLLILREDDILAVIKD